MVRQWQDDVREKHHCLKSNKQWRHNDKMMLGINIIEQHYINDGQKLKR